MNARVLKGSKSEIAESFVRISGDIHEVIVFVDEPSDSISNGAPQDIFAEMESFTVKAGGADYSRQALYSGGESERP